MNSLDITSYDRQFKAILMRNRYEKIAEINKSFIGKIKMSMEEINSFELEIPQYIMRDNQKVFNQLYLRILPRQQIITETTSRDGTVKQERWIITSKGRDNGKNKGTKKMIVKSFEQVLKEKRCTFEGQVMQLISDNIQRGEGILDKFKNETGWGIDYIDEDSKNELISGMEVVNVDLFNNFINNNVLANSLIFDKNVVTTIANDKPLYLSIQYEDIIVYDEDENQLSKVDIFNSITDPLYTNIKNIKAYHYSVVGNRYGIRYVFTLTDDTTVERICTFTNVIDKKMTVSNIKLVWETGTMINQSHRKYINIESIDDNWYDYLREVQDEFNSIFFFNSFDKTISCVSRKNLTDKAPYLLSYDTNILNVNVTENEEYPNALKVISANNISIISENIFGGDKIYNFNYYTKNKIMSDELNLAWARYEDLLTTKQDEWLIIKNNNTAVQQRQTQINSEITSLNERMKYAKSLLSGYITANDSVNQARIKDDIDELTIRLNQCLALVTGYNAQILAYEDELAEITKEVLRENATDIEGKIFTVANLEELNDMEYEVKYEDSYYSTPYGLLEHSKNVLEDMTKNTIEFKITCLNLIAIMRQDWTKVLKFGDLFTIGDKDAIEELGDNLVRFIGYTYDPKNNKIEDLDFVNKTKKIDIKKTISNIGKKASYTSNLANSYKDTVASAKLSNNFVGTLINEGLDLASTQARGKGNRNYLVIDENGILIYDQQDNNKCLFLTSDLLCISEDGFKTSKVAISSNAIIAETIAGKLICGQRLIITNDNGNEFYIGNINNTVPDNDGTDFGLRIGDNGGDIERIFLGIENGVAKLRLRSANGNQLVITENGLINHSSSPFVDNVSSGEGNEMTIPIKIPSGVNEVRECIISLFREEYRLWSRGLQSGGGSQATTNGGGAYVNTVTSTSAGQTTSSENGTHVHQMVAPWTGIMPEGLELATDKLLITGGSGMIYTTVASTHTDFANTTWATYEATGNHSHDIQGHSHNVNLSISEHNHVVNIADHTHTEEIGVRKISGAYCSNISITVNGVVVASGINSDAEVDITQYIDITKTWNIVKIYSDTNGRLSVNVFEKRFISY